MRDIKFCQGNVGYGTWGRTRPCKRDAVKDGFCTQHHPDSVAKRKKEAAEAWQRKHDARMAKQFAPRLKPGNREVTQEEYDEYRALQKSEARLVEALRSCVTDDGAACYELTSNYGRSSNLLARRIEAINEIARTALAEVVP